MTLRTTQIMVTTGFVIALMVAPLSLFAMGSQHIAAQQTQMRMGQKNTMQNMTQMKTAEKTATHEHSNNETKIEHEIASNYEEDHIYYKDMNLDITEFDYVN